MQKWIIIAIGCICVVVAIIVFLKGIPFSGHVGPRPLEGPVGIQYKN
jgi:hypothetical protein